MRSPTPSLATSLERAVVAARPWAAVAEDDVRPAAPRGDLGPALVRLLLLALVVTTLVQVLGCTANRHVRPRPGEVQRGVASWYGPGFHGRLTANGEVYDMHGMSAAHRTLPLGSVVEVTNLENGRRVRLRINDRGPFVGDRVLDLSRGAADRLGMLGSGLAEVEIRVVSVGDNAYRAAAVAASPSATTAGAVTYADAFTVQVGAFRDAALARALHGRLARDFTDVRLVAAGDWLRVQVGRFAERAAAEDLLRRLLRRGQDGVVVPVAE